MSNSIRSFDRSSIRYLCTAVLIAILATSSLSASSTGDTGGGATGGEDVLADPMAAVGLAWIDWAIIGAYALSTVGFGWYFGRQQTSTQEYFVGSGNMNWLLIGVSLFATLLSTISYLSIPGEILGKGPVYLTILLALPIVYVIVAYGLLPLYMRHRVTSAYELLEAQLGLSVRLLGAVMFLVMRLVWMSLLVYLAAKAMTVMLGVEPRYIPIIVLVTGFVSVIYTSLGGLKAVVITDLVQTILLFGGALLVIAMITYDTGGLGWFPTEWQPNWDTQPIFSFDPQTRITVVGTIVSVVIWYVCTAGGDQVSVQRFMATRDLQAARRSLATQLVVSMVVHITLVIVGLALLGYFQAHQGDLPANMSIGGNADDLFPHFISFHLPIGVSGLVVAAMFAAAMSSIDSGVNSITAVVMTDFLDRFGLRPETEKRQVLAARLLALAIGAIVVVGSAYMEHIPGNITAVTNKTVNLLTPSLFALFFFALFVPFSTSLGVWIGWICGIVTAILTAFSGPIFGVDPVTGYDPISFQWIGLSTLVVNLTIGTVVSWLSYRGTIA
ncbi:MAG: sodium/solute symporter [Pirellulales bacterium]